MRLLAVSYFLDGLSRTDISTTLKVARSSVNRWVTAYLSKGLSGLDSVSPKGRPSMLSPKQLSQLAQYVENQSCSAEGGRLMGQDFCTFIKKEFDIDYHRDHVYKILKKLGYSWITSRSKHPKQSQSVQDVFKKFQMETILNIPFNISLDKVDVWFQDEARFGQQNTTTRLWAKTGSRPRAVRQQQFEYAYMFGAVCPSTGATEALISPVMNKDVMKKHLEQISQATPEGRYAVVVMDGAGWHAEDTFEDLKNLAMIKLPPYSPELNPIEQVWQWLRQNCLANRCFNGYENIVDECSHAWNIFRSDIKRVMSLCNRDWINLI
ncbi:IS630 family transposase [Colwellia sp. PAMC 21821]|uniref:IS630 family transposase n=1 Tax=Colwellia sp. PAMC 21821 TaxID=1816219 RepID=UPI0012DD02BC|nr:IS630 family transposase [Colwellia sp. PAMC 21821]